MPQTIRRRPFLAAAASLLVAPLAVHAQKKYDTGASDSEIKIGNIMPYSGPASSYGIIGKVHAAYFNKVNAEGGIHGRKINFISLDDAYNPAQTVEQARKLVERDRVLLLFGTIGTAHNTAILRYMNQRKVPLLFINSAASRWGEHEKSPWSMGWAPTYEKEWQTIARHILQTAPDAKIGILMQNDDFGKDSLKGLLDGLGEKAKSMIVSQQTYEITDPSIDSQIINLKNSGANVLANLSLAKAAVQSIRKVTDIGWQPRHYLSSVSASVKSVLEPAGLDNAKGIMVVRYTIDPFDPDHKDSQQVREYLQFMQEYYPEGDIHNSTNSNSYSRSITMVKLLEQCGDDLTRANIMRQAANMDFEVPMLLPGVRIKTAPDDHYPLKDMQLVRFDGARFIPV